jgi:hypothetical protein
VLGEFLNLDRKIKLYREIAKVALKGEPKSVSFGEKADELRVIRNVMANYASWIEPVTEPGSERVVSYKALIAKGAQSGSSAMTSFGTGWP